MIHIPTENYQGGVTVRTWKYQTGRSFFFFFLFSISDAMGIPGLSTFLRPFSSQHTDLAMLATTGRNTFVVDGMSLMRNVYHPGRLDWVCGGQWRALRLKVKEFIAAFARRGFRLGPQSCFILPGALWCPTHTVFSWQHFSSK